MQGRFRAKALEGDYGTANTGTEQVAVLCELEGGTRLTWYGYLSEAAVDRTLEALQIMGVTDLETLAGLGSQEFEAVVDEEEYNGKTSTRIKFINRLGSGGVALKSRMSDAQKKGFASRFKGKFLALQQKSGAAPAPRASAPVDNDDIPF
jgi:hypothetical protein